MSNIITSEGLSMKIGGTLRPFRISTLQTAIFCELQKPGFDLQDYHQLFTQVGLNQFYAQQAREKNEAYIPEGRKALSPWENAQFIYSALAAALRQLKQVVPFTVEDVMGWLDEIEQSEDPEAPLEAAKPLQAHYQLLAQKINRQAERMGNDSALAKS